MVIVMAPSFFDFSDVLLIPSPDLFKFPEFWSSMVGFIIGTR
jgi:hypothetical protein